MPQGKAQIESVPAGTETSRQTDSSDEPRHLPVIEISLTGLFVIAAFGALYFAQAILIPIALALLLNLLLAPLVRRLAHLGIPEGVGAAVVLVLLVATVLSGVVTLSEPAMGWLKKAPENLYMAEVKLRSLFETVEEVRETTKRVEKMAEGKGGGAAPVVVKGPSLAESFVTGTSKFVSATVIMIVLLYFLLASGDLFLRKLVQVLPRLSDKKRAVEIARQTEHDISTYLVTITLINTALGVATGTAMYLLGMPNPVLWGVTAAVLNFIPYLGPLIALAVIGLVAVISFESWAAAILPPAVFLSLTTIEGQFLTPLALGRRLTLNPVVIFLALLLWGWLWGIPGILMAVPLLAAFKIFCDRIPALMPLGGFLGRGDSPPP